MKHILDLLTMLNINSNIALKHKIHWKSCRIYHKKFLKYFIVKND